MIDFENLNRELDESTELLDAVGMLDDVQFTQKQVKFINLLIVRAIEKYDSLLNSQSK